jgi:NADH:ubiquinone oxidoreductase subunit F (NADH-binding)
VRANASDFESTGVVVNGAEGEPGTFKDRTILLNNPYQVIEGALIAARAVGADHVVFALKKSFAPQVERLSQAIAEVEAAGWTEGVALSVFEGPNEYLYGEETALLETIDGRYPFPRVAPPFRRGVDEVVESEADLSGRRGSSAHVEMAGPSDEAVAPPTLVDNVETLANVPRIIARGGAWFRTEGTDASPGTIVCTITGSTVRAGVGEVIMGTTLREAIDLIGGGAVADRTIKAAMSGVANGLLIGDALDTPLTYEDMAAAGSGLGSAGFVVFDDHDDLVAAVAGVSRFLAVESCGQCTPCKQDGARIADVLDRLTQNEADDRDLAAVEAALATIDRGARCYLATQHQVVVRSLLEQFPQEVRAHLSKAASPTTPGLTAELTAIAGGVATVDERHRDKQPDWTYGPTDSGQSPVERLGGPEPYESLPS